MSSPLQGQVAVVTGGGNGIGHEVALELARQGALVVVMDPGVGVQGEPLGEATAAATAARITALGGSAVASTASVTDRDAVRTLFQDLVRDHGSLDIVINAAGILRFPRLMEADEDDWTTVLDVHLNGYVNVLLEAVPLMAKAGYGRVVAFTSGAGLARTAPGGTAYGPAKRAIASLTWELGGLLPVGVTVNALSPIAATRMVRHAIVAASTKSEERNPSELDLSAMPQAEEMAPAAAYLAGEGIGWCQGHVIFSAGSELSVIAPPRILEAIRSEQVNDFRSALDTLMPVVLTPAEGEQRTGGGANPRFADIFTAVTTSPPPASARTNCLVLSDDPAITGSVGDAVRAWGMTPVGIGAWEPFASTAATFPDGFDSTSDLLRTAADVKGAFDAIVVAVGTQNAAEAGGTAAWEQVVESHACVTSHLVTHAAWLRAAARYANEANRPVRIVHLTRATSPAGQSAAQAVTQLTRSVNDMALSPAIDAFSVSVESTDSVDLKPLGEFVARLLNAEDARALRGAELVAGRGWIGLRSHPQSTATVSFGGPEIPPWVDQVLKQAITNPP